MMKNRILKYVFIFLVILLYFSLETLEATITYNRTTAMDYAQDWCGTYNSQKGKYDKKYNTDEYYCYDSNFEGCKSGSNCANYASQVLIAGSLNFSCVRPTVRINDDGVKGIVRAAEFPMITSSFCFKELGTVNLYDLKDGKVSLPAGFKKGDVIAFHRTGQLYERWSPMFGQIRG